MNSASIPSKTLSERGSYIQLEHETGDFYWPKHFSQTALFASNCFIKLVPELPL